MDQLTELRGDRFWAVPLTADDGPQLQRVLEESADYSQLVLGRPPGPAEAQAVLYAGPEDGRAPLNKMIFGIKLTDADEIVGVLDGFRNYPESGAWYIGLLLLCPRARSAGIGDEIVEAFALAARDGGAHELQLNVVEQNEAGHRFWSRCEFADVRRWRQRLGERESTFIRMRRELHPGGRG